ncbi:MAG: hypothetical protein WCH86_04735 [Kiritimatiellales bacterium]
MNIKSIMLIVLLCIYSVASGSNFELTLARASVYAYIDKGWEPEANCVEARIRTNMDIAGKKVKSVAYFYNENRELVRKLTRPTQVSLEDGKSSRSPLLYEKDKKYEVYFGISPQKGDNKWKYVIVVVGTAGDYVAEVYPRGELADFEFDEKSEIQKKAE